MSAERQNDRAAVIFEQPDNVLGHFKRTAARHADLHFASAADSGEVDMLPAQFGPRPVEVRANFTDPSSHVTHSPMVKRGSGTRSGESCKALSYLTHVKSEKIRPLVFSGINKRLTSDLGKTATPFSPDSAEAVA